MVGYQRFGLVSSAPRITTAEKGNTVPLRLGSETAFVVDDQLDLRLRQHVDEVRHPARRDAALAVQLVGRDAERDPVDLLLATRFGGELDRRGAAGEVRPERAAPVRLGRGELDVVRVLVRRAAGVAARAVEPEEDLAVAHL